MDGSEAGESKGALLPRLWRDDAGAPCTIPQKRIRDAPEPVHGDAAGAIT